jgi:hypothetical protein
MRGDKGDDGPGDVFIAGDDQIRCDRDAIRAEWMECSVFRIFWVLAKRGTCWVKILAIDRSNADTL